jgi:pilus assembly protein Flp/PilA
MTVGSVKTSLRSAQGAKLETKQMKLVARFLKNESGATAIEYGLIAALISVAIIGGATAVGGGVNNTFTNVSGKLL